jgi:hypothetical protein
MKNLITSGCEMQGRAKTSLTGFKEGISFDSG